MARELLMGNAAIGLGAIKARRKPGIRLSRNLPLKF